MIDLGEERQHGVDHALRINNWCQVATLQSDRQPDADSVKALAGDPF